MIRFKLFMIKNPRCFCQAIRYLTVFVPLIIPAFVHSADVKPRFLGDKKHNVPIFSPKSSVSNGSPILSVASSEPFGRRPSLTFKKKDNLQESLRRHRASQERLHRVLQEYSTETALKESYLKKVAATQTGLILCLIGSSYYHNYKRSAGHKVVKKGYFQENT